MKHYAFKFLLCYLLISSSFAYSQNIHYKTFTLPANGTTPKINCLYQNKQGYILVAATTGLFKFDGISFHKIPKETNVPDNVTAIYEAKDGNTWLGFNDGKLGWMMNNKLLLQNPEEGLPTKTIKKIIQDSAGVVWIATAGEGIYYYKDKHFYNINEDDGLSDNYVYDLAIGKLGLIAVTDRGMNTCRFEKGKKVITNFTSKNKLPDNIVRAIANINGEDFWIAMQDAGIGTYTSDWSNYEGFAYQRGREFGQVDDLIQVGKVLYAASDKGLLNYEILIGNDLGKEVIITNTKTNFLLQDSEGNIWAAGNDQLIRTSASKLQPLVTLPTEQATNLHTLLLNKDNHLWMNVSTGLKNLSKKENGKWTERLFKLPVSINAHISALYEDKFRNIWIGTMGNGLMVLDAKTGVYRKLNEIPVLTSASILSITGKDDNVWIASLEGAVHVKLNALNKNILSTYTLSNSQNITRNIGTNYIYDIYTDSKGRTWFATDGKGLSMWSNGQFTHYTDKNGLKSKVIYKIAEDKKGNIWFSTFDAGVIKFNGTSFKYFAVKQGLSDLNITSLASDNHGNIFVSHKKGIDIINTNTETISYLDTEHGITDVNTDLNTLTSDKEGNVYFIANNSIYRYSNQAIVSQPKIIIERIQLFLNDVDAKNGHVFEADEDNISFYFTGLYYSNPERIQYQYKLENYDQDWITTMDRRKDFPRLSPGTYTFKVRASLNKNFTNAQEASFTFTIQKPIWMRWWFIALLLLFTGGILFWYIKNREKRLKKWERLEKEKIQSQFETLRNQVNPHFLFNSFNTLVSEIEDDPKRAVEYVERLSDFFRSIVTYREKDLISLKEELNIIKDYLFIQRKRYGCAFAVDINITPEQENQYMIAPLTMQLLAENAVKHNAILKDKPLLLEMFIENDWLIVRNNINPKKQPEVSTRLGLQNIIKRYGLLTGKNVIINKNEKYFTVHIPIIKKL